LWLQAGIQRCHGVHNGQPGAHCPLGGIFVRLGIAKVDQQAIAQVLRHVTVEGLHRHHRGPLVGAHYGPVVFRIKLLGERRRVDQIAEHHRQLAAFGLRRVQCGCERDTLDRVAWLGVRRRRGWGSARVWQRGRRSRTTPHQHSAALINGQPFGFDKFVLEGLKLVIVKAELHFEGPIGHAPFALQQLHHLGKDGIKVHHRPFSIGRTGSIIYGRSSIQSHHDIPPHGSQACF